MRVVAMLVTHQLTSHGIDPNFVEVFWILAGSIGAVMIFSLVGRILYMALYFVTWAILFAFAIVVVGHLALAFM